MFKVKKGPATATPPENLLHPKPQNKRQIKATNLKDCASSNTIGESACNYRRPPTVPHNNCKQHRKSLPVQTAVNWNHPDNRTKPRHPNPQAPSKQQPMQHLSTHWTKPRAATATYQLRANFRKSLERTKCGL